MYLKTFSLATLSKVAKVTGGGGDRNEVSQLDQLYTTERSVFRRTQNFNMQLFLTYR